MIRSDNFLNFSSANRSRQEAALPLSGHHHPGLGWVAPLAEVNEMLSTSHEAILVGASDQYRLGELLMPHVLSRLVNFSRYRCGGLVNSELSEVGAHPVRNYGECILEMKSSDLRVIHFGGSQTDMDLVEGYRAAAKGNEAERFESLSEISSREDLVRYVRRRTGQRGSLAYVVSPEGEFYGAGVSFHAVSLPPEATLSIENRTDLLRTMRQAQFVGVRDERSANFLASEGITCEKMPCALSVLPQVCARQLREFRDCESLENIRHRFPNGWIAVEVGEVRPEDFDRACEALREVSDQNNLGLVFFESTQESSHGKRLSLRKWVEAFPEWQAAAFGSLHIWEIASFLLHSRLYCGSCLSARVICMSGGIARINFAVGNGETQSYCELWEHDDVPIQFDENEDWAVALQEALAVDLSALQQHAAWLHLRYRESLNRFCEETGMTSRHHAGTPGIAHTQSIESIHHLHDDWLKDSESMNFFKRLNRRMSAKRGTHSHPVPVNRSA
jgi:hypothetical protein